MKKNKKQQFTPYVNYGMTHTNNLVMSFFMMYSKTYASNKHLSERLAISTSTITRSIKKLEELGYIEIYNPKGRSRFIRVINQPIQYEYMYNQNEEVNQINMMNNNKVDYKPNYKAHQKPYKKLKTEIEEVVDDWDFDTWNANRERSQI